MLEEGSKNGAYILPWGRFGEGSPHVFEGLAKRRTGERLWGVCEEIVAEWL
jgi:retinol dehydrogenase 12